MGRVGWMGRMVDGTDGGAAGAMGATGSHGANVYVCVCASQLHRVTTPSYRPRSHTPSTAHCPLPLHLPPTHRVLRTALRTTHRILRALHAHTRTQVTDWDPTIEDFYVKTVTVDGKPYPVQILDTAGQEDFKALIPEWMADKDGYARGKRRRGRVVVVCVWGGDHAVV